MDSQQPNAINTVLSIDWDFFFYRGMEAEDLNRKVKVTDGDMVLWPMFDWGHSENQGGALQQMLWHIRFQDFKSRGLDPYIVAGINPEFGCTPVEEFQSVVQKALNINNATVNISDSHRHAYYTVDDARADVKEPVHVIHFDAHHDLGYGESKNEHRKKGVYDCSDWLYAALDSGIVRSVQIVYPNWRGLSEKKGCNLKHLKNYNVKFTTWNTWRKSPPKNINVVATHIARSGSWVPPWFDKQFEEFTHLWQTPELNCMDCVVMGQAPVPHGCEPREWEDPHVDSFQLLSPELPESR